MKHININIKKFTLLFVAPVLLVLLSSANISNQTSVSPSNAPREKGAVIKLGFIPLTDCAPIVMAKELGLFTKYGVNVEVTKEASWANVRDKILTGELDGAHCLFSMPFSVYTGVGGKEGRVEPGIEVHDRSWIRRLVDQQIDDPLGPGRAALGIGGHDDVAFPGPKRLPSRMVDDGRPIRARRGAFERRHQSA